MSQGRSNLARYIAIRLKNHPYSHKRTLFDICQQTKEILRIEDELRDQNEGKDPFAFYQEKESSKQTDTE